MFVRKLKFSREKFGSLKAPSSLSNFSISFIKELCSAVTPSSWVWRAKIASCWNVNSTWNLLIDSWSWVIEVACTYRTDSAFFASSIHEFSLTLNSQSEDKEVWIENPAFFKSLNAMTWLFSQSALTLRLSASLSVEMKLSRGRARQASLSFDCSWDMIDPIYYKRKPLSDKVHLLVSLMVLGNFESNREQIALKLGETNESNGSSSVKVLFTLLFLGSSFC